MAERRDILIIGNGFDLHFGLPTRYSDFLFFINNWSKIYYGYKNNEISSKTSTEEVINITLGDKGELVEQSIDDFSASPQLFNSKTINYINSHINNVWIDYLKKVHSDNKGWVDFEKDIEDALHKIEQYYLYLDTEWRVMTPFAIKNNGKYNSIIDVFELLKGDNPNFMDVPPVDYDTIYKAKKKLISELAVAIDILENILYLYLKEFASRIEIKKETPLVFDRRTLYILSFNYTRTSQKIYNLSDDRCHYVHGNLNSECYEEKMVKIL